jgi:predicted acyltransferase
MPTPPQRVLSIDVLRGLTIALMILVNDPGDWAHTYRQLDHAPWNGFTLTDLVFPNFLFLVGASIVFSIQSRIAAGTSKRELALHILRRAAILFAIKMALTAFPHFHYTHFRLYGVLTRIALCYLLAGLLCLVLWNSRRLARDLLAVTAGILVGYWLLMRFVPVPGLGTPTHEFPILDPDNNLAAWLDRAVSAFTQRWLHTGRLYETTRDPEGLLSTLPALATTLIGSLTALWIRRLRAFNPSSKSRPSTSQPANSTTSRSARRTHASSSISRNRCMNGMTVAGVLCLIAGFDWGLSFPINKNLWTSSYVLYAAGWSLLLLALCFYLVDIQSLNETRIGRRVLFPWLVFGSNALTAYVLSNFLVLTLLWIKVPDSFTGTSVTAWLWAYRHLFARHASTNITSLAFALVFTALCFVPNLYLYRRKIFLKI